MAFRGLFLFLFLLVAQGLHSQTVEWGNPQKIKQKTLYTQIVGENASGVYTIRCKTNDFSSEVFIERYKSNLNFEMSLPLPISINGNVERVLMVNQELFAFISARNTQTGNIDILVQKIDAALKAVGLPSVICSFPANLLLEKRKIQIKTSADKKQVLMLFLTKGAAPGECKLNLYGYNEQVQQQFGKQFTLNHSAEDVFITNFDSDNTGNAFVLLDFPTEQKSNSLDVRDFYLYGFYPSDDKMLAYSLGNANLFIEELALSVNNFNKSVSVFGFYSEAGKSVVNGYFLERFDIEKRSTIEKYASLIDADALQQVTGSKIERKNPDLKNYFIRRLIPRSDGGVFLVAEKYSRVEQHFNYYQNNIPMDGIRITYNYDDAIFFSVNKDGSIHFGDVIRKRQSSVGDGGYFSGIFVMPTQDNIVVCYNSELDKDGNIMARTINYQGRSDERIAVKSSTFNVSLIPGECKQTGPSTFIGTTIKDKQFTLMRITY